MNFYPTLIMLENNPLPFITVCMPVRNESRFITVTLKQLLDQEYPEDRFEIIVADGESDDGTQEIVAGLAESHPQVILKNNPKRLSSAGRNIGFKSGRGDIFLVVDGHCYIPTKQLFKNILHGFEKSGADCLCRPQPLDPPDITTFQKAVALARQSRIGHGADSLIYSDYEGVVSPVSHGAVYKRHVFEKIGYVDESFDACEDVEFNFRVEKAGLKSYMSPSIAIKYYPRESFKTLFRQMIRYGSGRFKLLKKHPETFSFFSMMPSFFIIGIILTPLSFLVNTILGFSALSIYILYILLLLIMSVSISINTNPPLFPYISPIFYIIHAGLGLGFFYGMIRKKIGRL